MHNPWFTSLCNTPNAQAPSSDILGDTQYHIVVQLHTYTGACWTQPHCTSYSLAESTQLPNIPVAHTHSIQVLVKYHLLREAFPGHLCKSACPTLFIHLSFQITYHFQCYLLIASLVTRMSTPPGRFFLLFIARPPLPRTAPRTQQVLVNVDWVRWQRCRCLAYFLYT